MVRPTGPTSLPVNIMDQLKNLAVMPARLTTGIGSFLTTIQSANTTPSSRCNPILKSVKFIWNAITRLCTALYGLSIALLYNRTGPKINNDTFLIWLNQNRHHFKDVRVITKNYQAALKYEDPRKEFFRRVDDLKNQGYITGPNAYSLKKNFSLPTASALISHNADIWLTKYKTETDQSIKKQMRKSIFRNTKEACKNGFSVNGNPITLDANIKSDMQNGTELYTTTNKLTCSSPAFTTEKIEVINDDTIDVALLLKNEGYNPVAINMANENHPGGGAENGAAAQEESLFRRSNYHESLYLNENPHLKNQMSHGYRIPETGVIYSPNVQVFRACEEKGFAFTSPETMSFIAVAAYNLGKNRDGGNDSSYERGMKEKIRSYLRVAYLKKHDAVVLGALGCGAFANDPDRVSGFFAETLQEEEFAGRFKKIVFAVINDHNGANFNPFSDTLKDIQI
ncbi:MAG: TIGR02452 family protein [Candidatus Rhabdochlamydia sp.]